MACELWYSTTVAALLRAGADDQLVSRGNNRPFVQLWRCRELLQSIKLSSLFLGGGGGEGREGDGR